MIWINIISGLVLGILGFVLGVLITYETARNMYDNFIRIFYVLYHIKDGSKEVVGIFRTVGALEYYETTEGIGYHNPNYISEAIEVLDNKKLGRKFDKHRAEWR